MRMLSRKIARYFLRSVIGKTIVEITISGLANLGGINLLKLAYRNMGIQKQNNFLVSGEQFVIDNVLDAYVPADTGVFFDVGANIGNYSRILSEKFPHAKIYASENRIGLIRFEFSQTNIISRVFLKDFFDMLRSYKIYRLDTNRLIPLFEYSYTYEIFQFQNFLAIHLSSETLHK